MGSVVNSMRFAVTALLVSAVFGVFASGCSGSAGRNPNAGPIPTVGPTSKPTATPTTKPTPTPTTKPTPTPTPTPAGILLRGPFVELPFVSQGRQGFILVPPQIDVPPKDYATVAAGPKPQASMNPLVPVPGPVTQTLVYTATTFTQKTFLEQPLGMKFALPDTIDPDFGTFYLAVYDVGGRWRNVASAHGTVAEIDFEPPGGTTTYSAMKPHGLLLYRILSAQHPKPIPSPSSLNFDAVAQTAIVTVTEPDYYGTIAAASQDPSIATVAPAPIAGQFVVTSVKAGKTKIVFTDSAGGAAHVNLGVTTSGGGIH
jgi:hypothetical protein